MASVWANFVMMHHMSCLVIHGEDISSSRKYLTTQLAAYKSKGFVVTWLNGSSVKVADLESAVSSQELFASSRVVVIENLHKNTKTTATKEVISFLSNFLKNPANDHLLIIVWEQRSLTPTMLKAFPGGTVQEFKIKASIFEWLDSIGSPLSEAKKLSLLNQARANDDDYYLFIMLCRQIRLLLLAYHDGPLTGPPFMQAKLRKQAHYFTAAQLLGIHTKLTMIDLENKLGQAGMSLSQHLDLLTIGV
jgi:DNA polymerase III delta subunit